MMDDDPNQPTDPESGEAQEERLRREARDRLAESQELGGVSPGLSKRVDAELGLDDEA